MGWSTVLHENHPNVFEAKAFDVRPKLLARHGEISLIEEEGTNKNISVQIANHTVVFSGWRLGSVTQNGFRGAQHLWLR